MFATIAQLQEVFALFNEPSALFAYSTDQIQNMEFLSPKRFILYEHPDGTKIIWVCNMGSDAYLELDKEYTAISCVQMEKGKYKLTTLKKDED